MGKYSAAHLSNPEIRERLLAKLATECANEADILVLLGEADSSRPSPQASSQPSGGSVTWGPLQTPGGLAATSVDAALLIPQLATRPAMSATPSTAQAPSTAEPMPPPAPEPRVSVALERRAHQKLQYARALLSHSSPSPAEERPRSRAFAFDVAATISTRQNRRLARDSWRRNAERRWLRGERESASRWQESLCAPR
jgi:hypothetical protein